MLNSFGLVYTASWRRLAAAVALGVFLTPLTAEGQQGKEERGRSRVDRTAEIKLPPPGMCRIWIEGVPGSRQPAPTDCATALRNRPANGRVVFGDELPKARSRSTPGRGRKPGND